MVKLYTCIMMKLNHKLSLPSTFLLMLSLVLLASGTTRHLLYDKMNNKRFQNVLRTLDNESTIACCEACYSTDGCDLVSYNKQSRTCELHEFGPGHEVYIGDATGWNIFYSTADDCASRPCQNSGVCNDGIGHYTCTCTAAYEGTNCQTPKYPSGGAGGGGGGYGGKTYFILAEARVQLLAQARCVSYGGRLANVKTAGIYAFLVNLFNTNYPSERMSLWIGATALGLSNTYYWSDGTAVASGFTAWIPGEPNNVFEPCVCHNSWNSWNDCGCLDSNWSFCEI